MNIRDADGFYMTSVSAWVSKMFWGHLWTQQSKRRPLWGAWHQSPGATADMEVCTKGMVFLLCQLTPGVNPIAVARTLCAYAKVEVNRHLAIYRGL
jgi:hypothetical protein